MIHTFSFPTEIRFGVGARRLAGDHLREHGLQRPLIVTDESIAALPMLADFCGNLRDLKHAVFSGVTDTPSCSQVGEGVAAFRKHRADCVVGFGGGASIDMAKAIALMAVHEGSVLDYAGDRKDARPIVASLPYVIAVPTTSGTGSEVGRSCAISEDNARRKRIISSPRLIPIAVFADPELTVGLPADVTAATGMDALAHNFEAFVSTAYHPMCDSIALEGARIASRALEAAVREPDNVQARSDMMMASIMGGVALQKELGAAHACAHALGAVCGIHHGLAVALMLDAVMQFNFESAPEKFDQLAGVTEAHCTEDLVPWLRRLKRQIGIGSRLSMYGARHEQIPELAAAALADPCHRTNPRRCGSGDFALLFSQTM